MLRLACLWNRSRIEQHVDGALGARGVRAVEAHLSGCHPCRVLVDQQQALRVLVRSTAGGVPGPEWTGFWPGIQSRLLHEAPRPVRTPWLMTVWKPFWGHPRLAFGGAMAGALALALSLWPGGDGRMTSAWAGPVIVQDAGSEDPEQSVMVYSTADQGLTVIWLLPLSATEES